MTPTEQIAAFEQLIRTARFDEGLRPGDIGSPVIVQAEVALVALREQAQPPSDRKCRAALKSLGDIMHPCCTEPQGHVGPHIHDFGGRHYEWPNALAREMLLEQEDFRQGLTGERPADRTADRPVAASHDDKCPNGKHEWSNQFGDDWTPDVGMLCDCRLKKWGDAGAYVFKSMFYCEHANESPSGVCHCPPDCGCREHMCRPNTAFVDNGHTCISDDGGTPNRKCYACEAERERPVKRGGSDMQFDGTVPVVTQRHPTDANQPVTGSGQPALAEHTRLPEAVERLEQMRRRMGTIMDVLTRTELSADALAQLAQLNMWHQDITAILKLINTQIKAQPSMVQRSTLDEQHTR